ncbi:MAG: pyridoxamine kinase [Lachnospiraceae bacterium]|nr:pyridoxamine kinase [Lachnospiraceae bacterium]
MILISKIPKKLAMINDIAGYGRCSTTVSLPIINAMGVQVCPVPTSVFSNHTGFPAYQFLDLTENMKSYLAQWESMELSFDGIYCGFLGSVEQITIVNDFLCSQSGLHLKQQSAAPVIIVDPVMGDNGRAYSTITAKHCAGMKALLHYASVITPNITEACLLTDTPYKESGWTMEELFSIASLLHKNGPDKIVITGIRKSDTFVNYIYESQKTPAIYQVPITGEMRHGTGDIFASIVSGDALNQVPFEQSVKKAADFVRICTEDSTALGIPEPEGVCFERHLGLLFPNSNPQK